MRSSKLSGQWSIVHRAREYEKIRFDCCKTVLDVTRDTIRQYRFCPVCGVRLTYQRPTRPRYYPAWAWNRGLLIPKQKIDNTKPIWILEESFFPAVETSWRPVSRIYCDSPLRQVRDHMADLEPANLLTAVHFRLAYRRGRDGVLIGSVSRPGWLVRPSEPL